MWVAPFHGLGVQTMKRDKEKVTLVPAFFSSCFLLQKRCEQSLQGPDVTS